MIKRLRRLSRRNFFRHAVGVGAVLACPTVVYGASTSGGLIAVAASLRFAFDDALAQWRLKHPELQLRVVYGATGTLVHQIENGAPFDAFYAADILSPTRLFQTQHTQNSPRVFARGSLSYVTTKNALKVGADVDEISAHLKSGKIRRFAIANPDLAPYGAAARQVLQRKGLWTALQSHLAIGENIAQAAQFAISGAADAGLVAKSLVQVSEVRRRVIAFDINEQWHDPIDHAMVRLKTTSLATDSFISFLDSKEGTDIFAKHGFVKPG